MAQTIFMQDVEGTTLINKPTFQMIDSFLGFGYHIFVDNYYTKIRLFHCFTSQIVELLVKIGYQQE